MGFDVYTGNLGSGKSLDASLVIKNYLEQGKNVIANYKINTDSIKISNDLIIPGKKEIIDFILHQDIFSLRSMKKKVKEDKKVRFNYIDTKNISVKYLIWFYLKYHDKKKESQTLLVIDEASFLFNSRTWNKEDRMEWITFFKLSRKFGFDIILITQDINDIDKQLRKIFDYNVIHKKLTSYKIFKWLSFINVSFFVKIYYSMTIDKKDRAEFFVYKRSYSKLYDTYDTVADVLDVFDISSKDILDLDLKYG